MTSERVFAAPRNDYEKSRNEVDINRLHDVTFCVQQRNIKELEKILAEVSDPFSPSYGKYLSSADVAGISANSVGSEALRDFLRGNSIDIVHETLYGEYITARGTIAQWELMFSNKFHEFNHATTGMSFVRSTEYTIPGDISHHVSAVFNVTDLPSIRVARDHAEVSLVLGAGSITPATLISYYNIDTSLSSIAASQTVYSTSGQLFSSGDIALFQSTYGIPNHPVDSDPQHRNDDATCSSRNDRCYDSNLYLEYAMAIAQKSNTSIT